MSLNTIDIYVNFNLLTNLCMTYQSPILDVFDSKNEVATEDMFWWHFEKEKVFVAQRINNL